MAKMEELLAYIDAEIQEVCEDVRPDRQDIAYEDMTAKEKFCRTASTQGGKMKLVERYKHYIFHEKIYDIEAVTVQILTEYDEDR